MSSHPLVTVVIPCRNEVKGIGNTLHAVFSQDWPPEKLQVCVVDGLSDDGTLSVLKELQAEYPQLEIIENPQQLTPVAMNLGLQAARGELYWRCDAHQKPAPHYLKTCYQLLQSDPSIGAVGGLTQHIYDSHAGACIAKAMMSPFGVGPGNWRTLQTETDVDSVTAPLYRKDLLLSLGGFDENLIRNQDDELNFRVLKAGYRIVFTPQTTLEYTPRSSFSQLFRQYYQYGYWKVYVNRKHQTVTTKRQLIPAAFVLFLFCGGLASYFKPLRQMYALILGLYVLLAFVAARMAAPFRFSMGMVRAFGTLHTAYGLGYLEGLWRFMVRKQAPKSRHQRLSR